LEGRPVAGVVAARSHGVVLFVGVRVMAGMNQWICLRGLIQVWAVMFEQWTWGVSGILIETLQDLFCIFLLVVLTYPLWECLMVGLDVEHCIHALRWPCEEVGQDCLALKRCRY
jgi:hypothetical protein